MTAAAVASLLITAGASAAATSGVSASPGAGGSPGSAPASRGVWASAGVLLGSTQPSQGLSDYQWDTSPQLGWGGRALVGTGRFAAGVRVWRVATTQELALEGTEPPAVQATSVELVGEGGVATWWGARWSALASVGRLHLAYHPDRLTIQPSGTEVHMAPIDEWIAGAGVSVRRPIAAAWSVGLEIDHRVFGLDTARHDGGATENQRESFGEWSARLELARLYRRQ
jgi:hypothetical protein